MIIIKTGQGLLELNKSKIFKIEYARVYDDNEVLRGIIYFSKVGSKEKKAIYFIRYDTPIMDSNNQIIGWQNERLIPFHSAEVDDAGSILESCAEDLIQSRFFF